MHILKGVGFCIIEDKNGAVDIYDRNVYTEATDNVATVIRETLEHQRIYTPGCYGMVDEAFIIKAIRQEQWTLLDTDYWIARVNIRETRN